jgi:hypothetical protein
MQFLSGACHTPGALLRVQATATGNAAASVPYDVVSSGNKCRERTPFRSRSRIRKASQAALGRATTANKPQLVFMKPERWRQIDKIYHSALEHERQRQAFLREACAGDEALRQEVESLLAHQLRASLKCRP